MAIVAKGANGHVLKVKDEFAGKSGLCPHCHGRVFVPMPVDRAKARISDEEILGMLGEPDKLPAPPPELEEKPATSDSIFDHPYDVPAEGSAISLQGSSILKNQKVCPKCGNLASISFTHCPRCATPLPDIVRAKK